MEGHWLTIPEYSDYREKSISTVRRYIKSNQVQHKLDDGKYYIFVSDENYQKKKNFQDKEEMGLRFKLMELESRVRSLEEENNDLKMLVQIYELEKREETIEKVQLPEIPNEL